MIDRFLKLIVILTLLLFLAQAITGVFARALGQLHSGAARAGSWLGAILFAVPAACFVVGLLVRTSQFITHRDPRAARERSTRDRAVRLRVRRPAEGVLPVEPRAEVLDDPDPAIGDEERE